MASNNISLRLPVDQPPPEQVPTPLRSFISEAAWQARLRAVTRKGSRYIKPKFDLVWVILTLITSFALPIAMFYVALHVLPTENDNVDFDYFPYGWDEAGRVWKARGISMAVFIGVVLVMWLPMLLWKLSGKRKVNKMLQRFENEDRAVRPNVELPTYRISMPQISGTALNLTITVPGGAVPTSFQSGAQLPPYMINPPTDPAAAAYGYGQAPPTFNGPGYGVPLYNQFDEKVPEYVGPAPGLYMPSDEKHDFEDVRV